MTKLHVVVFGATLLFAGTSQAWWGQQYVEEVGQDVELDAYNAGWDAAAEFCMDLQIPEPSSEPLETFNDACQDGFADYVHGEAACVQELNKWQWAKFWKAIIQVCNQETPWEA